MCAPERRNFEFYRTFAYGFQSTLPAGGATLRFFTRLCNWVLFQSTLPAGGATAIGDSGPLRWRYFNPRSPRGERLHGHLCAGHLIYISIHAPRGGSDFFRDQVCTVGLYFNPRSPRGERLGWPQVPQKRSLFQSTLPAGGATAKTTKSLRKTCAGSRKC